MPQSTICIKEIILSCLADYKSSLDNKVSYERFTGVSYFMITSDNTISTQVYPAAFDNSNLKYALAFPKIRYTPFNSYYDISDFPAIVDNKGDILSHIIHGKWELRFCKQSFTRTPNKIHYYVTETETSNRLDIEGVYWFSDMWNLFLEISNCNNMIEARKSCQLFLKNKALTEKQNALELAQSECNDLRNAIREYQALLNEIKQQINESSK